MASLEMLRKNTAHVRLHFQKLTILIPRRSIVSIERSGLGILRLRRYCFSAQTGLCVAGLRYLLP